MATVLIVHGAGTGGWLWQRMRRLLTEAGHEVYTPTLTGVGDRAHLTALDIDLNLHTQDILAVLDYEDLHDVTLVGHSYGGMVVVGVAAQAAERLRQIVYLDAFVPADGQSLLDLVPPQARAGFEQSAQTDAAGRKVSPPLPYPVLGRIGADGVPEAEIQRLLARRVPQPFATYTQPVHLMTTAAAGLPHTYILCTDKGPFDVFAPIAQRAREQGWRYHELSAGHFPMLSMPGELADLLISLL